MTIVSDAEWLLYGVFEGGSAESVQHWTKPPKYEYMITWCYMDV